MIGWAWMSGAVLFEVVGTLGLRASDGFRKRAWIPVIVISYVLSFTLLGLALSAGMPVGVAYGVWSATGLVLIALASRLIWREPLTVRMVVGIGLLAVGVLLVQLSQP